MKTWKRTHQNPKCKILNPWNSKKKFDFFGSVRFGFQFNFDISVVFPTPRLNMPITVHGTCDLVNPTNSETRWIGWVEWTKHVGRPKGPSMSNWLNEWNIEWIISLVISLHCNQMKEYIACIILFHSMPSYQAEPKWGHECHTNIYPSINICSKYKNYLITKFLLAWEAKPRCHYIQ